MASGKHTSHMKAKCQIFSMAMLCLFFTLSSCEKNDTPIITQTPGGDILSDFEIDNENWLIDGEVNEDGTPSHYQATGGNPGGCIRGEDNSSGSFWTFKFPYKFLGNKSDYYGGEISFDFYVNKRNEEIDFVDIIFTGNGTTLFYSIPKAPALEWHRYEIYLSQNKNWKQESSNGLLATRGQIESVLSNIESIELQGEYRTGKDEGFLDNVLMEEGIN